MKKVLHQVWVQGEDRLPEEYQSNRAKWRAALPDDWEMMLWDDWNARERWPVYDEVSGLCSHHAMRCDLILALALRDIGGLACGTDVTPNNAEGLLKFLDASETMVVTNPKVGSCSNGLVWMAGPQHPMMKCLCRHQLRDRKLLASRDVWAVTGPRCWWTVAKAHMWDLVMVTDRRAYTLSYGQGPGRGVVQKHAWVDPGYAKSWHGAPPDWKAERPKIDAERARERGLTAPEG